jgi:hypothetical protein
MDTIYSKIIEAMLKNEKVASLLSTDEIEKTRNLISKSVPTKNDDILKVLIEPEEEKKNED